MKSKNQSINNINYSRKIALSLALITLLSSGMGLVATNSAAAIPSTNTIAQNSQQFSQRLPQRIARAILRDAAKRSGVPVRDIRIIKVTPRTFGNPCEFKFGEICTKEFNPIEGWVVIVQVQRQAWTYHVDKSGTQIILDPKVGGSQSVDLPQAIANAVLQDAAKRSGLPLRDLKITKVTPRTFGNPCEFNFGQICTTEFNPIEGWVVLVQVQRQTWTYHVDKSGKQIVSVDLPKVVANAVLQDAAKVSGLPISQLSITQAQRKTFGNACEFAFGEVCPQIFKPVEGWVVVVQVRRQLWTYHVSLDGTQVVLDPKVNTRN